MHRQLGREPVAVVEALEHALGKLPPEAVHGHVDAVESCLILGALVGPSELYQVDDPLK